MSELGEDLVELYDGRSIRPKSEDDRELFEDACVFTGIDPETGNIPEGIDKYEVLDRVNTRMLKLRDS